MKLKKIIEKNKKYINIDYVLTVILPISLLIWILGQIGILLKYNCIIFFSWWQIFSDTAILVFPMLMYIVWYYTNNIYYLMNPNKSEKFFSLILIFITTIIALVILWLIFYIRNYLVLSSIFYIFGILQSFFIDLTKNTKYDKKYINYIFPSIPIAFILLITGSLFWIFTSIYESIFENIYVNHSWKTEKVNYINDKIIIIWTWQIIKSDSEYEFILKEMKNTKKK